MQKFNANVQPGTPEAREKAKKIIEALIECYQDSERRKREREPSA